MRDIKYKCLSITLFCAPETNLKKKESVDNGGGKKLNRTTFIGSKVKMTFLENM